MKALNNIRNILYCGILFGAFANFAQNGYGLIIMGISEFLISLIFISESIIDCRKNWHINKFQAIYLLSEQFLIGVIFMGGFFKNMHYPGAAIMIPIASLFLFVFYFTYGIRVLVKDFKKAKILSILVFFFFIASLTAVVGWMFKLQHYPLGAEMNYIAVISGILFIILIALKIKFNYNGQTITLQERIMKLQGKPAMILVFFGIWSFYFRLVGFGIAPPFYTLSTPPVLNKLYMLNDRHADTYDEGYGKFIDARSASGDLD